MARVPNIEEKDHPELAPLVARIKAERGKVLDLYKVLLHSPAVNTRRTCRLRRKQV